MADDFSDVLGALLGGYKDRFSAALLDQRIASLPADLQGRIYQAVNKYAGDVDLTSIGQANSQPGSDEKTTWTVAELLSTDFPDPVWLVPDVIPVGLVSLAGKPKVGKSRLSRQLMIAKGSGGYFLGHKLEKGGVLAIVFEDPPTTLKENLIAFDAPNDALITFKTDYRLLNNGGLDDLTVAAYSGEYELIVIDTFGMAVGQVEIKDYSQMVNILKPLHQLAKASKVTFLLIDHHSKLGDSGNPVLDLIGSIGKSGTFDVLIGLYREKRKREAKLAVVARTLKDDIELALTMDHLTGCWQSLGDAGAVRKDSFKGQIIQAIHDLKAVGELPTTTRIKKQLGEGVDIGYTSRIIGELIAQGTIYKLEKVGKEQPFDVKQVKE